MTIFPCFQVGILHLVTDVIAPLPPCTPFLWVNKMIESNNWTSDMNPYYPVKPCPYKDPDKAPPRLRFAVFSGPKTLLYHVVSWIVEFLPIEFNIFKLGKFIHFSCSRFFWTGYHHGKFWYLFQWKELFKNCIWPAFKLIMKMVLINPIPTGQG